MRKIGIADDAQDIGVGERYQSALLGALEDRVKRGQPSDPLLRALAWDRFWAMIYQETKTMLIERALAEQEEEEKQQQQQQQQQKSA